MRSTTPRRRSTTDGEVKNGATTPTACDRPSDRLRAGELGRREVSAVINDVQTDHPILDAHGRAAALYRHQMDGESAVILPFAREALA